MNYEQYKTNLKFNFTNTVYFAEPLENTGSILNYLLPSKPYIWSESIIMSQSLSSFICIMVRVIIPPSIDPCIIFTKSFLSLFLTHSDFVDSNNGQPPLRIRLAMKLSSGQLSISRNCWNRFNKSTLGVGVVW